MKYVVIEVCADSVKGLTVRIMWSRKVFVVVVVFLLNIFYEVDLIVKEVILLSIRQF